MAASFQLITPVLPETAIEIKRVWEGFLAVTPRDNKWITAFEQHQQEHAVLYEALRCKWKEG